MPFDTDTAASGKFYQAMTDRKNQVRAYYDLKRQPASWDFWTWITYARKLGANHIVFDPASGFSYPNEPHDRQQHLFDHVVLPICDLWGVTCELNGAYQLGDITCQHIYQRGNNLTHDDLFHFELDPVAEATVTLRHSYKHRQRNSDLNVWVNFAEQIGAEIIEDAWHKPLTVADRFDIYREAKVNYFANNGPGAAAIWSNLPAVMVNPPGVGQCIEWIPRGTQYPFSTARQVMLWEEVTLENLLQAHEKFINHQDTKDTKI